MSHFSRRSVLLFSTDGGRVREKRTYFISLPFCNPGFHLLCDKTADLLPPSYRSFRRRNHGASEFHRTSVGPIVFDCPSQDGRKLSRAALSAIFFSPRVLTTPLSRVFCFHGCDRKRRNREDSRRGSGRGKQREGGFEVGPGFRTRK